MPVNFYKAVVSSSLFPQRFVGMRRVCVPWPGPRVTTAHTEETTLRSTVSDGCSPSVYGRGVLALHGPGWHSRMKIHHTQNCVSVTTAITAGSRDLAEDTAIQCPGWVVCGSKGLVLAKRGNECNKQKVSAEAAKAGSLRRPPGFSPNFRDGKSGHHGSWIDR